MSILQIISIILLGQFLGYKELGIYTIFQIVFRLALSLFEPGMFVSLIQKKGFTLSILNREKKIQRILTITGILILLLFFSIEKDYATDNFIIVILCLLLFGMFGFFSQYTALLTRQLRQKEISISQIIASSLEFIVIITMVWFVSPLLVFTFGLFFRFVIYFSISGYYARRCIPEEDGSTSDKDHIRFSSYQMLNQGLSFVQGNFDTVLVATVFGLTVLGPYNYASEISYLLFSKINPVFNKAIFPVLAKFQDHAKERQHIISESLLSHALVCISIYLLLFFNIEHLIPIVAKDPDGLILQFATFILIMAMIRSITNIMFNQLLSLGESKNLLRWNIAVLIFNYAFIAVIYLTGSSILRFLSINIFVSLSVLIFIFMQLRNYFDNPAILDKKSIIYVVYVSCCVLGLYALTFIQWHFILNIFLGFVFILGISLLFYKQKVYDLIQFRII
jgi:O-antigen/teichoic acid export membrane protein